MDTEYYRVMWGYRTAKRVITLSRGIIALHPENYTFIGTGKL